MKERAKKGIVIGAIVGLFFGFFVGAVAQETVESFENRTEKNENGSNGVSTYELIRLQLRERINGYKGLTNAVVSSADISENEHPENISKEVEDWLSEDASCRHYAPLTFTIAAERGYENIALKTGYVIDLENEKNYHMWLSWENKSLEYPKALRLLKHETENIYSKDELWEEN